MLHADNARLIQRCPFSLPCCSTQLLLLLRILHLAENYSISPTFILLVLVQNKVLILPRRLPSSLRNSINTCTCRIYPTDTKKIRCPCVEKYFPNNKAPYEKAYAENSPPARANSPSRPATRSLVPIDLHGMLDRRQDQNLSEDELAAREAEAGMQGRTHNLLNQSVAAGYRSNGAISRHGSSSSLAGAAGVRKDQEGSGGGGGPAKSENKRSKRPRPGGPPTSPRAGPSSAPGGGGGAAAAAGVVVERPSAR